MSGMMLTPRERRLFKEFERMRALQTPRSLFSFRCASLDENEATNLLRPETDWEVEVEGLKNFLTADGFAARYPGRAPEKYLITYTCRGLMKNKAGEILIAERHVMQIVFGLEYPSAPPTFIWWTPIWHPNFSTPHICIQGHPFSIGLKLVEIVPEVGRMVQYQNYNIKSPLNSAAAEWAKKYTHRFPVDDRDILDAGRSVKERRSPLVELVLPEETAMSSPGQILELIDEMVE